MNQHLQKILDFIQQDEKLTAEEKALLTKAVKSTDSELSISEFKLDRTEKVKRTTAILLEETIEELEQKRKAVEAQNRELEIEKALEKVRSSALAMKELADMVNVCHLISDQMELLNVKNIRNVQTAIIYETEGVYFNYEYYTKHNKELITEVDYKNHEVQTKFANQMLKSAEELFTIFIKDKELKDWYAYQKTTNQFADTYLENAEILCYYWYSLGPVALGISTYVPLTEEEINLFKRFRNVFELAYTRFLDIEKAIAQAKEARLETALERVRAVAMAMRKPEDLSGISETLFTELKALDFNDLRNTEIIINNDSKETIISYYYSDYGRTGIVEVDYKTNPTVQEWVNQLRKTDDAFAEVIIYEKEMEAWNIYMEEIGYKPDTKLDGVKAIYYYSYSIGLGALSISSFTPVAAEQIKILERFRNVFNLSYQRYADIALAEAQAKEAQIELALERVRARTMAMQKSEELSETAYVLFQQFKELGEKPHQITIGIINEAEGFVEFHITGADGSGAQMNRSYKFDINEPALIQKLVTGWKENKKSSVIELAGKDLTDWVAHRNLVSGIIDNTDYSNARRYVAAGFFTKGLISISIEDPIAPETIFLLERFTQVFEQTYIRFLDLQKAEAQAREAQIETALERVRSHTLAMHKSDELADAAATVFHQLQSLGISNLRRSLVGTINDAKAVWECWYTTVQGESFASFMNMPVDGHPIATEMKHCWEEKKMIHIELIGEKLKSWVKFILDSGWKYPQGEAPPEKFVLYGLPFSNGYLMAFTNENIPLDEVELLQRFARVFDQTYTRFLDLQKAEAQAREAQIETGLERVRSRTLAMQKSDELAETAAEVFKQLINLGIEPNRLYIGIVKDESGDMEMWATDEDGTQVGQKFIFNKNENASVKKLYDGWAAKEKSVIVDMEGKELEDYFHYLNEVMHIPFKGGLTQKRRVQSVAYFSKGFIGMASPDGQGTDTLQLLERFAAVFNLTFTRFNDLKIAEAHAEQAEQDLIAIKEAKQKAEDTLIELQATQKQLIQSEKMASLGELTAGIAHEIQNPLNFVNNFSEVSTELVDEMNEEMAKGNYDDAKEIANDVKQNLVKINHHGKRAGDIVKGMLQHSRSSSGVKEPTDINALCDEYLRLSYHGLRAKDKSFNATIKTDFDASIGKINIIPQDIGRVVLNLLTNAFYVVDEKKKKGVDGYEPTVTIATSFIQPPSGGRSVAIKVSDNGGGIPQKVLDKIFQPFFTTKPTGEGTGLGLSLSYDIITKGHGGELKVETKEGEGSEFIIQLSKT